VTTLGPLPWDRKVAPDDPIHGVFAPGLGAGGYGPAGTLICADLFPQGGSCSPILSVPDACDPFWNVSAWTFDFNFALSFDGNSCASSGSIQIVPVLSGIDGRTAGNPALVTADLIDCYGHGFAGTPEGSAPTTWTGTSGGGAGSIIASYFQCLLMSAGNPTQAQVAPFVNANDNTSAADLGNAVDIGTAPNVPLPAWDGVLDLPQIVLSVSAGGRWPNHAYSVPIYASFADGSANTGLGFSGSASLTALTFWTY
jgi:hypothetical protein